LGSLRLSDRKFGSEFCKLERTLIFDERYRDCGFVNFLTDGSFTLRGSRFTDVDKGRVYLLPPDLRERIDQGMLVEVVPGKVEKAVIPSRRGTAGIRDAVFREVAVVEDIREAKVPLPPPALPVDEFLYRISSNWRSASDDMLDIVMALLMVSAPSSVYGEGGLGSEGLEVLRSPGTGTPLDVSRTIFSKLPVEFRMRGSSPYRYSTVESTPEYMNFKKYRAPENTYSVIRRVRYLKSLKRLRIPVHLPFVLKDAEMSGRPSGPDLDVLEYQLTALYTPPPDERLLKELGEKLSRDAHRNSVWDGYAVSSIDPLSSLRLTLGLTRVHIGKTFDGRGFSRKMTDLEEGQRLFNELLSRGAEEIERRMKKERMASEEPISPWRGRLKPIDREVFFELRTRAEEQGTLEFSIDSLPVRIDRRTLEGSLERLNRYGYILFLKGGTRIRLVIDSSPEDES